MTPPLRLLTLGALRLAGPDGDRLSGRRKELALVAYIARQAPRRVPREALAALFWGERGEARARHSLRTALLKLRQTLGDAIETTPEAARIAEGAVELDAAAFERDVAEGRLAEAVERWYGDFLAGAEDVGGEEWRGWLEAEREGLRRRLAWALDRLSAEAIGRGDAAAATRWAARWTDTLPLDERGSHRRVDALRLAGRPDEALAHHGAYVARVRETLGHDPSPAYLRLAASLLARDRADHGPRRGADPRPAPHASPGSAALLAPDLVGRATEFAELAAAWQAARDGGSVVVLIEGEEGLGKTRLCHDLARWARASAPQAVVLRGRAFEAERDMPWETGRHLFAALADAPGVAATPPAALAAASATVLPALRERFRGIAAGTSTPPLAAGDVQATAAALARILAEVAAEVPVLLVLDDFPAADTATQALLRALARHPPPGVLQLYTGRPDALEALRIAPELRRAEARRIRLRPLGAADAEAMVGSMIALPEADRRRLAERLHAEGEGSPFYIAELVAGLADAGLLALDADGAWRLAPECPERALPMPAGVREVARERIERLSEQARTVLDAAAVLGERAGAAQLERAAGLPPEALDTALHELLSRRLLRAAADAGDAPAYEFSHDLTRRVALERVPPMRRQQLQRAAVAAPPAGPRAARRGTAPRRIALAAAGLLALSLGGGSVMALRARGMAATTSPDVVAVLPFAVRGDTTYAYLREGMADLLSVSLDGIGALRTVDRHALLAAAARQPDATARAGTALDPARAGRFAARFGAGLYVLGEVTAAGDRVQATATLYGAQGGARTVARATATGSAGVFELVDSLTRQLVASRYAGPAHTLTRLAVATTPSVGALRAFLDGERELRTGRYEAAVSGFQEAVAADSAFALAHYRLSVAAEWALASELPERAAERAAAFGGRLAPHLRMLLRARDALRRGEVARAESLYRRILADRPYDVDALVQLGELLFHYNPLRGRSVREAAAPFGRVLDVDPTNHFALPHLARIAGAEAPADSLAALPALALPLPADPDPIAGFDKSRALEVAAWRALLLRRPGAMDSVVAEMGRGTPMAELALAQLVTYSHDLDTSERLARAVAAGRPGSTYAHLMLVQLTAARGRLRAAGAPLAHPGLRAGRAALLLGATVAALPFLPPDAGAAPTRSDARREMLSRLEAWTPASSDADPADRTWPLHEDVAAVYLLGALDEPAGAVGRAAALERRAPSGDRQVDDLAHDLALELRARGALAAGRPAEALTLLGRARGVPGIGGQTLGSAYFARSAARWLRAEALRALGRDEEALGWYGSLGQLSPFDLPYLAPSHLRRAAILERRGDRARAAEHYAAAAALWRDADPELQPLAAEARRALARLAAVAR